MVPRDAHGRVLAPRRRRPSCGLRRPVEGSSSPPQKQDVLLMKQEKDINGKSDFADSKKIDKEEGKPCSGPSPSLTTPKSATEERANACHSAQAEFNCDHPDGAKPKHPRKLLRACNPLLSSLGSKVAEGQRTIMNV